MLAVLALEAVDVLDCTALVVAQIGHRRSTGADGSFHVVAAKALQRLDAELAGEGFVRGVGGEVPVCEAAERHVRQGVLQGGDPLFVGSFGDEQLGRSQALQFVGEVAGGNLVEREVPG